MKSLAFYEINKARDSAKQSKIIIAAVINRRISQHINVKLVLIAI